MPTVTTNSTDIVTPELDVNIVADYAKPQSIDFVEQFTGSINKLIEALGVTRRLAVPAGMNIKRYKKTFTLKKTSVGEGIVIPLSTDKIVEDSPVTLTFGKYRRSVSAEAIQSMGADRTVTEADQRMLREVQKGVRDTFFNYITNSSNHTSVTATSFQAALATAWGKVNSVFEDDGVATIVFCNPMDVAAYLGNAQITTQSVFGMNFITGFTGVTIITNTNVPSGKIYATAPDNLICAYIPITGAEFSSFFPFTTDATGLVGMTHQRVQNNLTYESYAITGVTFFAEKTDGVFEIEISEPAAGVSNVKVVSGSTIQTTS